MKKTITSLLAGITLTSVVSVAAMAASQSLNGGTATWYGGEADNIIYSKIHDNLNDGLRHKATVWVENDKGNRNEKTGTTNGVGARGEVKTTIGATHSNPFVKEKSGYKNYSVVK